MLKHLKHPVVTLITGSGFAQLLTLLSAPILTRLYSIEEFGIYTLLLSIATIASSVATGKYEHGIIAAKEDQQAFDCFYLIQFIAFPLSLILAIVLLLFGNSFAAYLEIESQANWLLVIPALVILTASNVSATFWLNRTGDFSNIAKNRIVGSVVTIFVSIALGFFEFGLSGLIYGLLAGRIASAVHLIFRIKSSGTFDRLALEKSRVLAASKRFIKFLKFTMLSDFVGITSSQIHLILLSSMFDKSVVGSLGLYQRAVGIPTSVISGAFGEFFKKRVREELHTIGHAKEIFWWTAIRLAIIGFFPFLILLFFGPQIFGFVFGDAWALAGEYAQILSYMFFLGFIVSPLATVLYVAEKQKTDLLIQSGLLIAILLTFNNPNFTVTPEVALTSYTIIYCIKYSIELFYTYLAVCGNNKLTTNQ